MDNLEATCDFNPHSSELQILRFERTDDTLTVLVDGETCGTQTWEGGMNVDASLFLEETFIFAGNQANPNEENLNGYTLSSIHMTTTFGNNAHDMN